MGLPPARRLFYGIFYLSTVMALLPLKTKHQQVREQRDALLQMVSDILQRHQNQAAFGLPTTYDADDIQRVARYAQALRDVPQQPTFPDVRWPHRPACLTRKIIA